MTKHLQEFNNMIARNLYLQDITIIGLQETSGYVARHRGTPYWKGEAGVLKLA